MYVASHHSIELIFFTVWLHMLMTREFLLFLECLWLHTAKLPVSNLQHGPQAQQNTLVPIMQDCLNAVTEHQKLQALVKGEWIKGLLPQSTVRADYTVQRIRGNLRNGFVA